MSIVQGTRQGGWWFGLCAVAAFAFLVGQIDTQQGLLKRVALFQFLYAVGYFGYLLLVWLQLTRGRRRDPQEAVKLLAAAIALRLVIFPGPESDDLYRAIWEGLAQLQGHNPYEVTPGELRLPGLTEAQWMRIPDPDRASAHSPLVQIFSACMAAVYPSVGFFKAAAMGWDILVVIALTGWVGARGGDQSRVGIYGISPLVLAAFAMEGHFDSMMLAWIALAGWLSLRRQWLLCGFCVGLAVLSKAVAGVVLLWLCWRHGRAALLALGVILVGYLPYSSAGPGLLSPLSEIAPTTLFNALLPACLSSLVGHWPAFMLCSALLLAWLIYLAGLKLELHQFGTSAFGMLIVVLPAVKFWHVSWVLLFCVHRFRWCWIVLAGSMVFFFDATAARVDTGIWQLPPTSYLLIWVPFLVTWAAEEFWRRYMTGPASPEFRQPPFAGPDHRL